MQEKTKNALAEFQFALGNLSREPSCVKFHKFCYKQQQQKEQLK